jgi:ABC-2 type transport system permease protein
MTGRRWIEERREPWLTNLRAAWARAYVRIFAASREPSWIIFETIMPVLGMFAYVFVYRALGAPPEFEAFVVLGGVMMSYWLAVLWSMGTQWYWEKQEGNLEFYLVAPCSRLAILAGMAIGGIFMTSIRAILALVLGVLLFHVDLTPGEPWAALGVFLLTLGALYALGMSMASLFLMYGREVWHVTNALQEPMYLVNGLYFPLRALGPWGFAAFSTLPLALGLDAMRQLVLGPELARGLWPVPIETALLAVALVVNVFVAVALLARLEHEGKKSGALLLRHQ